MGIAVIIIDHGDIVLTYLLPMYALGLYEYGSLHFLAGGCKKLYQTRA